MSRVCAIIFFGPPGSGKTTQAEELSRRLGGFEHLNIGRVIEKIVFDEKNKNDPKIQQEKEAFETGGLTSSGFVIGIVDEWTRMIAGAGKKIIFSGNPRRLKEAEFLIPLLAKLYGDGTIVAVHIKVKEDTTFKRSTHRLVCSKCGLPVSWSAKSEKQSFCESCGGKLKTRVFDFKDAIKKRLRAYHGITEEIIPFLKASGVQIIEVDGEQPVSAISDEVENTIMSLQ